MGTLINIKKYQKTDITKKIHKEIPLINQINIALYHLYDNPIPGTILMHHPAGHFTETDDINTYLSRVRCKEEDTLISSTDELILNHFIVTQEIIDENSIILGFFNIANKIYTRYRIKNIKRLCELLRTAHGDFAQILGKASPDNFKAYNISINKKVYLSEISSLISNASFTPIQNIHILKMLKAFTNGGIICSLAKNT